ncbi:MAG: CoA-binding protein, partial [Desulfobacterales bacterium]|nr:CoA-binding protein [Desulfobacterales bacterium]
MRKFFYPKSIAVAGLSSNPAKVANTILANLKEMEYPGKIFAIGKNRGEIFGIPIHTSLEEIKEKIDLLVLMVPAETVPDMLTAAGRAGIDRVVIHSAGFNELGGEGSRLARKIKQIADTYGIRFIGPNCQGIICPESKTCLPFGFLNRDQVRKGGVAIVAQSGSVAWLGTSQLSYESVGVSKVISIGNKLNVDELALLEYLLEDPETSIIVLYLESFTDGRKLCEMARTSRKPIIVFKSNTSGKPSALAMSHTAA